MTDKAVPRLSVDIISDVMCPWCVIGWLKFERVIAHFAGRLAFRVQWHPFELNPDMPPEGEDAAAHVMRKYGISAAQSRGNTSRLAEAAAELGFAMKRGPGFRMRNSFDAHRLLAWAGALEGADQEQATGVQTALKLALFRAHFNERRNLGERAVLLNIAASVGLHREAARAALDDPDLEARVLAEEQQAWDYNISGVPAMIVDNRFLIPGAQAPEVYVNALRRVAEKARAAAG